MKLGTIVRILSNYPSPQYHGKIGYITTAGPESEEIDKDGLTCYSVQFPYENKEERLINQVLVKEYQITTLLF